MVGQTDNISAITDWFVNSLNSLNGFGKYEQLQIILCAHAIGLSHKNIQLKLEELVKAPPHQTLDYVYEYLEQLIFLKYDIAQEKQKKYFNYWFVEGNLPIHTDVTQAYQMGYALLEENKIVPAETKQQAIKWLVQNPDIPSMSCYAWTIYYLAANGQEIEAKERLKSLLNERLENGSWNNFPTQTVQVAFPLSLSGIVDPGDLNITSEFLLSQEWKGFSGEICYETGLLKFLNATKQLKTAAL